jgi:hypothetical protein
MSEKRKSVARKCLFDDLELHFPDNKKYELLTHQLE